MRRMLFVLGLLGLAACGGPAALPVGVPVTQNFGESDPVTWRGRAPGSYTVHGIDVAKYQSAIDWPAARAAGANFAFIKATEGGDRVDPTFRANWEGARAAGVARGAYHFYYFCTDAETQAENFIRTVPRESGALPPVVDLEWNPFSPTCTYRPPPEVVRREVGEFIRIVRAHYGQTPILYTARDFWERNDVGRLPGELWLRSTAAVPAETYPGADWTFWQYSGTGRVAGIEGNVDLNAFRGSAAAWQDWLQRRAR